MELSIYALEHSASCMGLDDFTTNAPQKSLDEVIEAVSDYRLGDAEDQIYEAYLTTFIHGQA